MTARNAGALTDKATARMLHDHNLGPATIAALGEIEMALHGPSPAAPCDRAKRT